MRRYDIVSGILLILSIIDFARAAPVLVQEKRQACVDVVHIPKDVRTVLGKRGGEELGNVVEEYFKSFEKPAESSDAHSASSSAPPGPGHGSTDVVQEPGPNPESSTVNQGLKEQSSSSPTDSSVKGVWGDAPPSDDDRWSQSYEGNNELHDVPLYSPTSSGSEFGSNHGWPESWANWHALLHRPSSRPSIGSGSEFDWNNWNALEDPPPSRPASPKEFDEVEPVQESNPGSPAGSVSDFDWDNLMKLEDQPPMNPSRLNTKLDSDPNLMAVHRPPTTKLTTKLDSDPNLIQAYQPPTNSRLTTELDSDPDLVAATLPTSSRLTTKLDSDPDLMVSHQPPPGSASSSTGVYSPSYPMSMAHPPSLGAGLPTVPEEEDEEEITSSPGARLPTVPEHEEEVTPSSAVGSPTDSELEDEVPPPLPNLGSPETPEDETDRQAALYAAKGKEKVSRRISGTTRDVGNAVKRELKSKSHLI